MKLRTRLTLAFAGISIAAAACLFATSFASMESAYSEGRDQRIAATRSIFDANVGNLNNKLAAVLADFDREQGSAIRQALAGEGLRELHDALDAVARKEDLDVLDVVQSDGQFLASFQWPESVFSPSRTDPAAWSRTGQTGWLIVQDRTRGGAMLGPDEQKIRRLAYARTIAVTDVKGAFLVGGVFVEDPPDVDETGVRLLRLLALAGSPDLVELVSPTQDVRSRTDIAGDQLLTIPLPILASFDQPGAADRTAQLSIFRTDTFASTRRDLTLAFLAVTTLLLVASYFGARVLFRRVAAPIDALSDGARALAGGALDHRVPPPAPGAGDELGELVDAFNKMARDLQDSRGRLVQSERIAAWREIARRIAHEIKNPLTPIQLAVETTRRAHREQRRDFGEIFEESATAILEEVESLKKLVKEFSEFARMPEPVLAPEDLNETVKGALRVFGGLPDGVSLTPQLADGLPKVVLDREQIGRALINLVANAADAVGGRGSIVVRTVASRDERGPAVEIHVVDDGPGVPADAREKIFTPYFTTKSNGTGLGLAIVQRIVGDHGGEIRVDPGPAGKGADFVVRLRAA